MHQKIPIFPCSRCWLSLHLAKAKLVDRIARNSLYIVVFPEGSTRFAQECCSPTSGCASLPVREESRIIQLYSLYPDPYYLARQHNALQSLCGFTEMKVADQIGPRSSNNGRTSFSLFLSTLAVTSSFAMR